MGPVTKKPVKRYTVDGKRMTTDDRRRLHDYLAVMDTIAIIRTKWASSSRAMAELVHKLPPK
jgi:hypothetical protein